jgi:hypothetical protein
MYGLVGLAAFVVSLLLPTFLLLREIPRANPGTAPPVLGFTLCVLIALHAVDIVLNAMPTPIYMVIAGALASVAAQSAERRFAAGGRVLA